VFGEGDLEFLLNMTLEINFSASLAIEEI